MKQRVAKSMMRTNRIGFGEAHTLHEPMTKLRDVLQRVELVRVRQGHVGRANLAFLVFLGGGKGEGVSVENQARNRKQQRTFSSATIAVAQRFSKRTLGWFIIRLNIGPCN